MSLPLTLRPLVTGGALPEARRRSLWIDDSAGRSPLGAALAEGPGLLDTFVQGFLRGSMLCLAVCTPSRSMLLRRRTPVGVYRMGSAEAALQPKAVPRLRPQPAVPLEAPVPAAGDRPRPLAEEPELVEV